MKNETYEEFVEKFKPKKTTDDCYTPPDIYEIIMEYAVEKNGWQGRPVVRPFYPGGDFENYEYPANCVVIDNPPFSILSKIVKWYNEKGIDYFLFAPALTLFSIAAPAHIAPNCSITYENGAVVRTAFVSSKGALLKTSTDLTERIKNYYEEQRAKKKQKRKNIYPKTFITSTRLIGLARHGVDFKADNAERVNTLYTAEGKPVKVFGGGYKTAVDISKLYPVSTSGGEQLYYKEEIDKC